MSIPYSYHENPRTKGQTKRRFHARVAKEAQKPLTTAELLASMRTHHIDVKQVQYALTVLQDYLTIHLSEGRTVHLDGLGSFGITLSSPETRHPDEHHAQSIGVKGIKFRAEKKWVKKVDERATFRRGGWEHSSNNYSLDDARRDLTTYFQTHATITRTQFQRAFTLTAHAALTRLQSLEQEGFLQNIGSRACYVYKLAEC